MPTQWMPSTMRHGQDNDLVRRNSEVNAVRETSQDRPPRLAVDSRKCLRVGLNSRNRRIDSRTELLTEAEPSLFVPLACRADLFVGLRPKDRAFRHSPRCNFC